MMLPIHKTLILFSLVSAGLTVAQETPPVLPEPILPGLKAGEQSVAKVTEKDPAQAPGGRHLVSKIVDRLAGQSRLEMTWSDGTTMQTWEVGGRALTLSSAYTAGQYRITGVPENGRAFLDFQELAWIGKDNFAGESVVNGVKVWTFQAQGKRAVVDATTRQPVRFQDASQTWTYQNRRSTLTPGQVPPEVAKILDLQNKLDALDRERLGGVGPQGTQGSDPSGN